ncbi:MAG: OmpA family protein [Nannocystaceae bacterium]
MLSKLLLAPLLALFLWADEPFRFEFSSQTDAKGMAYLVVHASQSVKGIEIRIEGSNGQVVKKVINARAGNDYRITWRQKSKEVQYELSIKGGDVETDFVFDVRRPVAGGMVKAPSLVSSASDVVEEHKATYKTSFTMTSYQFKVYNTDGEVVDDQLVTDRIVEAGSTFTLRWNNPDEVFLLHLKGQDEAGRYGEARHVPWSAELPHTEVTFDSGKWDIKPDQEPSLDETFAILTHELEGIDRATAAVNKTFIMQLYVVGYTDTVGNAADNQGLSRNRAKAIAQYFYDKGAWCEIWFAGMGEKGLAVRTGDGVDEVRNRRARYLLRVDQRPMGPALPGQGAWKKLAGVRERELGELPALPDSYLAHKAQQREARIAKFGSGGSGGSSMGDDDDEPRRGSAGGAAGGVELDPLGDDDGAPPQIEGSPGATGKGCSVAGDSDARFPLWALMLGGIARARRGRRLLPKWRSDRMSASR